MNEWHKLPLSERKEINIFKCPPCARSILYFYFTYSSQHCFSAFWQRSSALIPLSNPMESKWFSHFMAGLTEAHVLCSLPRSPAMSVIDVECKVPRTIELGSTGNHNNLNMGMRSWQPPWAKINWDTFFNRYFNQTSQANKFIWPRRAWAALNPIGLGLVCHGPIA